MHGCIFNCVIMFISSLATYFLLGITEVKESPFDYVFKILAGAQLFNYVLCYVYNIVASEASGLHCSVDLIFSIKETHWPACKSTFRFLFKWIPLELMYFYTILVCKGSLSVVLLDIKLFMFFSCLPYSTVKSACGLINQALMKGAP